MISKWRRVYGVFLRYFYLIAGLHQIAELFFWPLVDILLWGLTTAWLQQMSNVPQLLVIVLTALIFWQIVNRASYDISVNLLNEFWSRNLSNLFSTPLTITEWAMGAILVCVCKVFMSLCFASLIVYMLYALNVFAIGWYFLPFLASLVLSGWVLGFLGGAMIIRWGKRVEMVAWMIGFVFAPFSAVFYPVISLPEWAQYVAWSLPMTYVFEGMRTLLVTGNFLLSNLMISFALNAVYLVAAVGLFAFAFQRSRVLGLGRLE